MEIIAKECSLLLIAEEKTEVDLRGKETEWGYFEKYSES